MQFRRVRYMRQLVRANLILVPIHASQCPNMRKDILQSIRKLESIDVAETELNMRIHDEFRKAEDLATQVEGVSETRLLALLRCQGPEASSSA
jgi:hypothetical protein